MIILCHNNIERAVIYMTVGERIVETRKAKGISQKQLSEMTGIPIQTLFRIEKGGNVTLGNAQKIAEALETTPAYLMGYEEPKPTVEHANMVLEVLKESGMSNGEILSLFTTQELAEELARRCGE